MTNEERMALVPEAMLTLQAAAADVAQVAKDLKAAQAEVTRLFGVQMTKTQELEALKKEFFDMFTGPNDADPA